MINNNEVKKVIDERQNINPNDPRICDKWEEITTIFTKSENDTIEYLNNCNDENIIYYLSEVFDDISLGLQSKKFIECIEHLGNKFKNLDLEIDIFDAKQMLY